MKNMLGVADYGMDVWYGGNFNLRQRLELLRGIGIGGIEWLKGASPAELFQNAVTFHRMGMDFASCNCGTDYELTLQSAAAFKKEYVWLSVRTARDIPMEDYLRRANDVVKSAADYGVKVALHNHLGTRIQDPEELDVFMRKVPGALLLFDIAHYHAAGGDCVEVVKKYHDRLAAVHFKDIFYKDKSIGLDRWGERLRFCELGGGNAGLDIEAIGKELMKFHYDKWVLIEHDTHLRAPEIDLKKSACILKEIFK